jgi:hypothetical protein
VDGQSLNGWALLADILCHGNRLPRNLLEACRPRRTKRKAGGVTGEDL